MYKISGSSLNLLGDSLSLVEGLVRDSLGYF